MSLVRPDAVMPRADRWRSAPHQSRARTHFAGASRVPERTVLERVPGDGVSVVELVAAQVAHVVAVDLGLVEDVPRAVAAELGHVVGGAAGVLPRGALSNCQPGCRRRAARRRRPRLRRRCRRRPCRAAACGCCNRSEVARPAAIVETSASRSVFCTRSTRHLSSRGYVQEAPRRFRAQKLQLVA